MRLLEIKNDPQGIGIGVADGALLNFKSLQEQNGAVEGAEISNSSGKLIISKGTISIQGFRLQIKQAEELFDINGFSTPTPDPYYVLIKVTYDSVNDDASFDVVAQLASKTLNKTEIQKGIGGTYEYPVARFAKNGATITGYAVLLGKVEIKKASEGELMDYGTITVD